MDYKFLNNHLFLVLKYFVLHITLNKWYVFHLNFILVCFPFYFYDYLCSLFSYFLFPIQFFSLAINCINVLIFVFTFIPSFCIL